MLLDLTINVPADEWGYQRRRIIYLEAMLLRVLRDEKRIREWFSCAELAGMLLPGMPTSIDAMARRASKEGWQRRKARMDGRWAYVYSVTALPARAFDALIARMVDLPDIDATVPIEDVMPPAPQRPPSPPPEPNTAPPWVLPLMRLMKTETGGNLSAAWAKLPERLPPGVILPTVIEAARVLVTLGLTNEA